MKLLYSQSSQQIKPYPRNDDQPIVGLDADYLVLQKVQTTAPEYDAETEQLSESWTVDIDNLEYRQQWVVNPIIITPEPDWTEFNVYLFSHPAFIQYGLTAQSNNPWLIPALVELYAKIPNESNNTFGVYWQIFCQTLQVSVEHRQEWASVAETNNLPADFVAVIRG